MFVHLRYLSFISFIIVLATALFIGGYFRILVSNGIVKDTIEKNVIALDQFVIKNVWEKKQVLVKKLIQEKNPSLQQVNADYSAFVQEITHYTADMPIITLRLYTVKGDLFLASNNLRVTPRERASYSMAALSEKLFSPASRDEGFNIARTGKVHSRIIPSVALVKPDNSIQYISVVETLVPIVTNTPNGGAPRVEAVVEVFTDITAVWHYLFYFQVIATFGVIVIFSVLYSVLFYSSARMQRLMQKQHTSNMALARIQTKAEAENMRRSQFMANISHELRTPLNAIIGFSSFIMDESAGPLKNPQYKEYIRDIHTSGTQLLQMINDMLDYVKIENGEMKIDIVPADITKLLNSVFASYGLDAEKAKITLVNKLPSGHLLAMVDAKRLKQVVKNLLSNAVKFTPQGGTVTLSAWVDSEKNTTVIEVRDTGIGIAPENVSKALSNFGQVDDALNRRYEGTGVGLPLTKKLTELMEGRLDLKSELGVGTCITASFPHVEMAIPAVLVEAVSSGNA